MGAPAITAEYQEKLKEYYTPRLSIRSPGLGSLVLR